MKDGIIKGSGNSRYLRTVANALTLYPNYESFIAALIQGTFPIDLNGINSSGWSTVGTKLNKASLLTDSLCSALGLSTAATPNQAMDKLRQLINTANSNADGRTKTQIVSYTGTDTYGESNPCSITFSFAPKLIMYLGDSRKTINQYNKPGLNSIIIPAKSGTNVLDTAIRPFMLPSQLTTEYVQGLWIGQNTGYDSKTQSKTYAKKSADGKTMSWYTDESNDDQLNRSHLIYHFMGIG